MFFSFSWDGVLDLLGFGYLVKCVFFIKLGVDMGACYWVWLFYCFVLGYQDIYGLVASGLLLLLLLFVFVLGFNAFWYWIHVT